MQIRAAAACLAAAATFAAADVYPMSVFENAPGASTAGLNLIIQLTPSETGASLTFYNNSTAPSVITGIYVEASPLSQALFLNPVISDHHPGASFSWGASPPVPPGSIAAFGGPWQGNIFAIKAASPGPANGLNPGEWLTISLAAPPESIAESLDAGGLRIVQHIQGVGSGGEGSIWASNTPIPAPSTAALLLIAGSAAACRRRR